MIHIDLDEINEELVRLTKKKGIMENALEKLDNAENIMNEVRRDLEYLKGDDF